MSYDQEFLNAAVRGDIDEMKKWLTKGADLKAKNNDGDTALLLAAANGHVQAMKWLVEEKKVSLSEKNIYGDTALLKAAFNGHAQAMKWLVEEKKISLSEKNDGGNTALLLAAFNGQIQAMKWLVEEKKVSLSEKNNIGMTALLKAAFNGHVQAMKWLVEEKKASLYIRNNIGMTALLLAAFNGQVQAMKWLVEEKKASLSEKNNDGDTALLLAAVKGHLPAMKWLVEEKKVSLSEKNNDGDTALDLVKLSNNQEAVNYLEQSLAKLSSPSSQTISSHLSPVIASINSKAISDLTVNEPMQEANKLYDQEFLNAAEKGDIDEMKKWLAQGADVNAKDEYGDTALMKAASNGHLQAMKWLVEEKKVSIHEINKSGHTAFLEAASNGQIQAMKWLVEEKKASLYIRNNIGMTALLLAAFFGQIAAMKWLVEEKKISLSERDDDGNTLLLCAAKNNQIAAMKWLVEEKQVPLNEKNKEGLTALEYAKKYPRPRIINYLEQASANQVLAHYSSSSSNNVSSNLPPILHSSDQINAIIDLKLNELIQKANQFYEEGNYNEAVKWYRKAALKDDVRAKKMVVEIEEMLVKLNVAPVTRNQVNPIAETFSKQEKNINQQDDNKSQISSLLIQAQGNMDLEGWSEATKLFDQILILDKYHLQALIGKGKVHEAQGELEKAQKCYEKAIKHNVKSNDVIGLKIAGKRLEEINQKINQQAEAKKAKEIVQQQKIAELEAQLAAKEEALKAVNNLKSAPLKPEPVKFFKPAPVKLGIAVANNVPSSPTIKLKPNSRP